MQTTINGADVKGILNQARRLAPQNKLTPSPEDWRDCWIYFLMVDRFANPATPPKSGFDVKFGGFQGGTIEGMRQKLDYLKELGVGAVWFSPVLKNCQFLDGQPNDGTYHGYGIQNFLDIDPRFASDRQNAMDELRRFIEDAHARGIYVIFDIVLNHTGNVFGYDLDENHNNEASAAFRNQPYNIRWHDEHGGPGLADISHAPQNLSGDAAIWPRELQSNDFFRRKGKGGARIPRPKRG